MNILFLTQILPYPPDAGPRIKTWHVLRYLVRRGHQVTLVSFVRPDEEQHIPVVKDLCHEVVTVPLKRSRFQDVIFWLSSLVSRRPFLVERDRLPEMVRKIYEIAKNQSFDLVHADQLTMAQFALLAHETIGKRAKPPALVFDAHNATWSILERLQETTKFPLSLPLALETQRVRLHEAELIRKFDYTLAVSEIDKQALLNAGRENGHDPRVSNRVVAIPIAVDTSQLPPIQRAQASTNILTLGTLHYPPNAEGIRWFLREVFPLVLKRVPEATLTVIGKNPPHDFEQIASEYPGKVNITGYIPDLKPYLEQAAIMVVPVLAGGGMRVRILEAFSRAMPVVTTTIGLEGIDAELETDVLVRDTPQTFAEAVVTLMNDSQLQTRLAENGRRLAITRYDWQVVLKMLDNIYGRLEQARTPDQEPAGQSNSEYPPYSTP